MQMSITGDDVWIFCVWLLKVCVRVTPAAGGDSAGGDQEVYSSIAFLLTSAASANGKGMQIPAHVVCFEPLSLL